jgi:hypothetical protein
MSATAVEVQGHDWLVSLDGNVLEVFNRSTSFRFHVAHLAIEGKEKGDGLKVVFGRDIGGGQSRDTDLTIAPDRRAAMDALFAEVKVRKDAWVAAESAR